MNESKGGPTSSLTIGLISSQNNSRAGNMHLDDVTNSKDVTPWTVPPRKWSPRTVHGRIIGPLGPNIAAIPGPPLLPTVPPAADCSLFAIAFCHSTCIWRTAWTLPVLLKQGEATSAEVSAGGGDDTTPIEEESA